MELKDKLNLLWKYLFLAVFTYAVVSMMCCNKCQNNCSRNEQVAPCSLNKQIDNPCGANCTKPCCGKKNN